MCPIFAFRAHDSHVFRSSDLGRHLRVLMTIPGLATEATPSIVADSAYPSLREIASAYPHKMRGITRDQRMFNKHLSSKRQVGNDF